MYGNPRRLRRPEERVGNVTNADLPPPANRLDDTAIVARIRRGDSTVFEHLLDLFYSPMLRVAMSFVRSRDEAEEVIQDTWVAVLAGIDRFEGRSSFKTWMFRILINRARSRARRESRTIPFSSFDRSDGFSPIEQGIRPVWPAPSFQHTRDPEQELLNDELRQTIDAAIGTLPTLQKMVITLRDVEGWSADEVCEALSIAAGNQRVLLHRARMHVREQLTSYLRAEALTG